MYFTLHILKAAQRVLHGLPHIANTVDRELALIHFGWLFQHALDVEYAIDDNRPYVAWLHATSCGQSVDWLAAHGVNLDGCWEVHHPGEDTHPEEVHQS